MTRLTNRRLGHGLVLGGAAVVPWLFALNARLPSTKTVPHWPAMWIGLDAMEALGLVATGGLVARGDSRQRLAAAATASLLIADAWFDLVTSSPGAERLAAVGMALGAELPIAAVCILVATRPSRETKEGTCSPSPFPARTSQPIRSSQLSATGSGRSTTSSPERA